MTHFSFTEKKKGRKEGGKKERRERKEGWKKEGKKERRQKKECKCVFRHFQFHVVHYPPHPQSTNSDQGPGKNDAFFIDRKEEKKEGRKEKREEGKKGGRRGRKKEGKTGRR